jgi:GDPmannose 4,6-dehydratase
MKKALITGALGQDGTYLTEHLIVQGYRVYGLVRKSPFNSQVWYRLTQSANVEYLYGDLRDELSLRTAIIKSWPDEIYNLAGQVFVPLSWQRPAETFDTNTGGLLRILKIIEEIKADTRVYQASSSEMFGNHEGRCTDETPMWPTSPYGVSKFAAHRLVGLYRERGLYVVAGILFNHESPRRGQEMVTRKIAAHVAAWSRGDETPLRLGNMNSRRDWGFAGEYVQAMHAMLQAPAATDYVVGTGVSHSVEDFLYACCDEAGVKREFAKAHLQTDDRMVRTQEIFDMRADTSKIETLLQWKPKVSFKELVSMMVYSEMYKNLGVHQSVAETA